MSPPSALAWWTSRRSKRPICLLCRLSSLSLIHIFLERRLDNAVYRLGLASSRSEARQLVRHNHFTLNGHKANIPSMTIKVGDVIAVKSKSKDSPKFKEIKELAATKTIPSWLELDAENLVGKVVALPDREGIDIPVEEHLIVELYSR